ncbi:MAG TPA: low temperature requirement protein A [Propionibacteriaceae bacterium]|nr:low temperature requirement protein A [Propionibacteriaceae bacterium]
MNEAGQPSRRESSLIRPPQLHLGRDGTASRLELFFDLAYVLVVMEMAKVFYEDLTWHGFAVMTGLFLAMWFSWVGFTLYANRFDTDDIVFRIAKLAATGTIVGCAASASDAIGKLAVPFAACYLGSRLVLLALYVRAWRHVREARPTIVVYLIIVSLSAALWAVSLVVPDPIRYAVWAIAVLVSAAGPVLATLRSDTAPLHVDHLPERFALLVILVLGEAVGGTARGVHDASWAPIAIAVGALAFAIAAGMWWIYFDVTTPSSAPNLGDVEAGEEDARSGADPAESSGPVSGARYDLFVYGHLPLTFGIVLAGVGLEELVVHPDKAAPSAAGWAFACGLVLFVAGVALVISGTTETVRTIWPWPVAAIPIMLLGALVPFPGSLLLTATYAVGILLLAALGTRAIRQPDTALGDTK